MLKKLILTHHSPAAIKQKYYFKNLKYIKYFTVCNITYEGNSNSRKGNHMVGRRKCHELGSNIVIYQKTLFYEGFKRFSIIKVGRVKTNPGVKTMYYLKP